MDPIFTPIRYSALLFSLLFCFCPTLPAQPEVVDAVALEQITHFETNQSISTMKMSADGSRIVFATSGPMVKVFAIDTDGTDLTEIYDFQRTGFGPTVDINATGEKVIWCDGEGEIFIANSDGTAMDELATLIPNPDTNFADLEPIIPLAPRITADGGQVFFIHMGRDPRASGVWKVNSDNSSLAQVFNYLKVASDVFGRDGTEYDFNTAFTDGFDISDDGSRLIFGTKIFKIEEGDLDRGDAIIAYGTEFYDVGDFAGGHQPFAIDPDGEFCIMYQRELNPSLGYDEINVYFVPVGTGDPVMVIGGLDIFGSSAFTQMASDGSRAITMAGNGRMPITFVDRVTASRLDLVSVDGLSITIGGWRMSESSLPSINANGDRFCFLAPSIPPQIWMGSLGDDGAGMLPKISGVTFSPDWVLKDGSTTSTIEAMVSDVNHPIHRVTFESFQNGYPFPRALRSYSPQNGFLVDDGTFGDATSGDGTYTNNTVTIDLPETPVGAYTVRIAAVNNTKEEITLVDAESMSVLQESTTVPSNETKGFSIYPNPVSVLAMMQVSLDDPSGLSLFIYDLKGSLQQSRFLGRFPPGKHKVGIDLSELPPNMYMMELMTDQKDKMVERVLVVRQ